MATAKEKLLNKIHRLSGALEETSGELKKDPINVPSIEVDRMLRQAIELYDNLKRLEKINLQQDQYDQPAPSSEISQITEETTEKTPGPPPEEPEQDTKEPEQPETSHQSTPVPEENGEKASSQIQEKPEEENAPARSESREVSEENLPSENSFEKETEEKAEPEATKEQGPQDEAKKEAKPEPPKEKPTQEQNSTSGSGSSLNEKLHDPDRINKELGEKFKNKPIPNLKSAITLNQKMGFIRELFNNDERAYKKAIDFLNKCGNHAEARFYLQDQLKPHYGWKDDDPQYQELLQLVQRRFL